MHCLDNHLNYGHFADDGQRKAQVFLAMVSLGLVRAALLVAVLCVAALGLRDWDAPGLKVILALAELAAVAAVMRWAWRRAFVAQAPVFSPFRAVLPAVIAAFALRTLWVLFAQSEPISDFKEYCDLARHLVATGVFGLDGPSAYRPPALAALLGVFELWGWPLPLAAGLLNAALAALTVPAIYVLAQRLAAAPLPAATTHAPAHAPADAPTPAQPPAPVASVAADQRAGIVAAWLWALWPSQVFGSSLVATEPLFVFCVLWAAVGTLRASENTSSYRWLWWAVLAGVGFGLGGYVRSHALAVPWLWGGLLLLQGRRGVRLLPRLAVVTAVSLLVMLPWGLRNQRELGQFQLTSTSSGMTLVYGNNAAATGGYCDLPITVPGKTELEQFHSANRMGTAWISSHPMQFIQLIPRKWLALLAGEGEEASFALRSPQLLPWQPAAMALCQLTWFLAKALAFAAVWRRRARFDADAMTACAAVLWTWLSIHAVFHGQFRYHAPLVPIVLTLAAVALCPRKQAAP